MEQRFLLQSLIKFLVWLRKSDVQHCDEGLLNSWCSFMKSQREVTASQGCENSREKRCIQLADVRDRNCSGDAEHLV